MYIAWSTCRASMEYRRRPRLACQPAQMVEVCRQIAVPPAETRGVDYVVLAPIDELVEDPELVRIPRGQQDGGECTTPAIAEESCERGNALRIGEPRGEAVFVAASTVPGARS